MGRRLAVGVGLGIFAVAVAITAAGSDTQAPIRLSAPIPRSQRGPLVGVIFGARNHARLVRLRSETLRVQGRPLTLTEPLGPSARSPDDTMLAVGSSATPDIQIVAVGAWHAAKRWRLAAKRVPIQALAWPVRRRLLALVAGGLTAGQVDIVDPSTRRVIATRRPAGRLAAWAPSSLGMTLILGPSSGIGAAHLVHVDADGDTLTTRLPGVSAGFIASPRTPAVGERTKPEMALPGLAIDERDELAFIATADLCVLAVNLRDGRVADLTTSARRSTLGRLRDWLEPAAEAKGADGASRSAIYVGPGLLVVSGQDGERPAGLRLVDLNRGTVRLLSQGGYANSARGRVLAVGIGKTLRAFDATGRRVWSRFPRGGIRDLAIGPRYAYVLVGDRTYVLDPRNGATVRVLATGRPPLLLTA